PEQQDLARVLDQIGYSSAMPYLKAILENKDTDATTREIVTRALASIGRRTGVDPTRSAGLLFYQRAERHYRSDASVVAQRQQPVSPVWDYSRVVGLKAVDTPTAVFGDVMALRTAKRALQLDNSLTPALALWLAANFRQENKLQAMGVDVDAQHQGGRSP